MATRILILILSLTLVAGLGLIGLVVWTNLTPPAPTAPTVEFRSVETGAVVTVAVDVRGERVTRAELWSANQLLARESNPNPALSNDWTVAWQWTPPAPGVYSLAARAFDDAGRYGASTLFEVVIPPRGTLLFSSNRGGAPGGYALYTLTIPTGETTLYSLPQSQDRQPNVSKTKMVAFTSQRGGLWHIFTRPLAGGQASDVTPGVLSAQRPVWSADAQRLAYEVTISDTTNIVVSDARGQNPVQVTQGDGYDGQASFSPDGSRLAFAAQQGGYWNIYTVGLDGSNLTRLTSDSAQDWQPAWSPDGGRIAFASNQSGISEIYVMSASGGEASPPVRLTNFPSGAEQPAWSPDGNWLAFVAYTGEGQAENRRELYLLYAPPDQPPSEGRGLVRLTQNAFDDTEPAWAGQ